MPCSFEAQSYIAAGDNNSLSSKLLYRERRVVDHLGVEECSRGGWGRHLCFDYLCCAGTSTRDRDKVSPERQ